MQKATKANPKDKTMTMYLLGVRNEIQYWLHEPTWDIDTWRFGKVCAYDSDGQIASYSFKDLFINANLDTEQFEEFFDDTPFSKDEMYLLIKYMKSYIVCRNYITMYINLDNPGPDYTNVYNSMNNSIIPDIFAKLRPILTE